MFWIATDWLISRLVQRDDGLSRSFVESYSAFVRGETEDLYRLWIKRKIELQGCYHRIRSNKGMEKRIQLDRFLIDSISRRGIQNPIRLQWDVHGLQIHGWHRAVIAHCLRIEDIRCMAEESFTVHSDDKAMVQVKNE